MIKAQKWQGKSYIFAEGSSVKGSPENTVVAVVAANKVRIETTEQPNNKNNVII